MQPENARSVAVVNTDRPARYAKQLVSHLGRRAPSEWSESGRAGWIEFGDGQAKVFCTADQPGARLVLDLSAPTADLERLEGVVGRHLVRFGTRDELVVQWNRDSGDPGTVQRLME
jgi:hypothetical protein